MPERDPVERCRFCGYLYYTVKLPVHEAICCTRADYAVLPPLSQTSTPLTVQESHSSRTNMGRSYSMQRPTSGVLSE
ncbi:MAG: hypothetical protein JRN06_00150 [Nitrososphaerota archaeon]|nr:hypothetical protein [Nitrososphaerota archaeon]MDG7023737.1 hypothetical protein [Nitrososphaerota archaeon]